MRTLPLLIAVLPVFGANLAFYFSHTLELIEPCNVYLEGCVSISHAGRSEPVIFYFRPLMIVTAVLMMLFWGLSAHWLAGLGEPSRFRRALMQGVGYTAGLGLMLYMTLLGSAPQYTPLREFGATVFFALTYLAQILVTAMVWRRARVGLTPASVVLPARLMVGVCVVIAVGLVIGYLLAEETGLPSGPVFNALEWNLSALLMTWFGLAWVGWRRTGFGVAFYLASAADRQWPEGRA
jgi:hypothetical protein